MNQELREKIITELIKRKVTYSPYQMIEYKEIEEVAKKYHMSCREVVKNVFLKNKYKEGNPILFNDQCKEIKEKYMEHLRQTILRKVVMEKIADDSSTIFALNELEYYSTKHKVNIIDFMFYILGINDAKTIFERLKSGKVKSTKSFLYEKEKELYLNEKEEEIIMHCLDIVLKKEEARHLNIDDLDKIAKQFKINKKDLYLNILDMSLSNYNSALRNNRKNVESAKLEEVKNKYLEDNKKIMLEKIVKYKLKNIDSEYFSKEHLENIASKLGISIYYLIVDILGKNPNSYYDLKKGKVNNIQKTDQYLEVEKQYVEQIKKQICLLTSYLYYGKISKDEEEKIINDFQISRYNFYNTVLRKNGNYLSSKDGTYISFDDKIEDNLKQQIIKECIQHSLEYGDGNKVSIEFLKFLSQKYNLSIKTIMLDILGKTNDSYVEMRHGNQKDIFIDNCFEEEKKKYLNKALEMFEQNIMLKDTKVKCTYDDILEIAQKLKLSPNLFVTKILNKHSQAFYELKTGRVKCITYGKYVLTKIPKQYIDKNYYELRKLVAGATMKVIRLCNCNLTSRGYRPYEVISENLLRICERGNVYLANEKRYLIEENETEMIEKHRQLLYKIAIYNAYKIVRNIDSQKEYLVKTEETRVRIVNQPTYEYSNLSLELNVPNDIIMTLVETMNANLAIQILMKKGYSIDQIKNYMETLKKEYSNYVKVKK